MKGEQSGLLCTKQERNRKERVIARQCSFSITRKI